MTREPHMTYRNSKGEDIPSCTEIVKLLGKDLMGWSNYLGFQRINYDKYMKELADYGTYTHKIFELIMNNEYPPEYPDFTYYNIDEYAELLQKLDMVKSFYISKGWHIVYAEHSIHGELYGGTLDVLLYHDIYGYLLLDLKTSKRLYRSHFIQLAGYCRLLREVENIEVSRIGIILSRMTVPETIINEYPVSVNDNNANIFNSLLDIYYNLNNIEGDELF